MTVLVDRKHAQRGTRWPAAFAAKGYSEANHTQSVATTTNIVLITSDERYMDAATPAGNYRHGVGVLTSTRTGDQVCEDQWRQWNEQRIALVNRKFDVGLTAAEIGELSRLKNAVRHYADRFAPLPRLYPAFSAHEDARD